MPQLSKRPLSKTVENNIIESFEKLLTKIETSNQASDFMRCLLTSTEKLMLAKRLATIVMIRGGYSYSQIRDILHVSQATVATIKRSLEVQQNNQLLQLLDKPENRESKYNIFIDFINTFMESLPPPKGAIWSDYRKRQHSKFRS